MRQEMVGFWDGIVIRRAIYKQSAPCSRQITTPAPHHSVFTDQMLFLMPIQQYQGTKGNALFIVADINLQIFCMY